MTARAPRLWPRSSRNSRPWVIPCVGDASDRVLDYSITEGDRVQVIVEGTDIGSIGDLARYVTADVDGNLVVNLADGSGLTIVGVRSSRASQVQVDLISGGKVIASGPLEDDAPTVTSVGDADEATDWFANRSPGEWLLV